MPLLVSFTPFGTACYSYIPLSLLGSLQSTFSPRLILKTSSFNQVSTVIFFFLPLQTFSYCLLLCHPGNDKGRCFPSIFMGWSDKFLTFSPCSWCILNESPTGHVWKYIPQCGYLLGKITHSSVGSGDRIRCDSISCILYSAIPYPWSPSPFSLVYPAVKCSSKTRSLW